MQVKSRPAPQVGSRPCSIRYNPLPAPDPHAPASPRPHRSAATGGCCEPPRNAWPAQRWSLQTHRAAPLAAPWLAVWADDEFWPLQLVPKPLNLRQRRRHQARSVVLTAVRDTNQDDLVRTTDLMILRSFFVLRAFVRTSSRTA